MEKEQFQKFVDETRDYWRKLKEQFAKDHPQEYSEIVEELIEESNKDTGYQGEDIVEQMIKVKNYRTGRTKNSETPADVWSINLFEDYIHIGLIQVKTTALDKNAASLSPETIAELRLFTKFVLIMFNQSKLIDDKYKKMGVVVSNGYIGLKVSEGKSTITNQAHYSFWIEKKNAANIEAFKKTVKAFHKF